MGAIAGFIGKGALPKLLKMLRILKHRGPDSTGIYYNGKTIKEIKPLNAQVEDLLGFSANYKFKGRIVDVAIGHNLLITDDEISQPIGDESVIVCDGRLYNMGGSESGCEIILDFLEDHGIKALQIIMDKFDGDYSFAFFDGENIILARDPIGVKPLHYKVGEDFMAFASERKALWGLGIKDTESLPPGSALINNKIIKLKKLPEENKKDWDYDLAKEKLAKALKEAVKERVRGLKRVGVLFSGGVDSTLVTFIARKYTKPTLYTVGVEGSQDLIFAEKAANELEMNTRTIKVTEEMIRDALRPVITAIEEFNIMKIGVAMPLYFASKAANTDGLQVILAGQGADELFGGYHRHLQIYKEGGNKLVEAFKADIQNMYHVNLERDDAIAMAASTELRVPFLDREIINIAFNIPIEYKIKGSDDTLRKHILRDLALDMGVPDFIAKRPKKAAQYGSGIDKILRKRILPGFDYESFMENLKMEFYKGYRG
ncbi:MAG TPA: asparagine synthetase B [Methanothermobacter sp.]|nr:asparagine synthetase [Methanothermobacter sp. MT-2]HHW05533.1 asparagine synthetase B [Methanothermobacter sp.]HOK72633.1 asparagine synthetase B [Methanothermobacter sp.]HOL68647.1 asparagine synthetase B [Methanothermobacter sp.]HPQ04406.1 asparagine synthetase B [Methanothermobacter sp.]